MKIWLVVDRNDRPIAGHPDLEIARGIRAKARLESPISGFSLRHVEIDGIQREDEHGSQSTEAKATA